MMTRGEFERYYWIWLTGAMILAFCWLLAGCAAQPPPVIVQQAPPPKPPPIVVPPDPYEDLAPQVKQAIQTGNPEPLTIGITHNFIYDPNTQWTVNCALMRVVTIHLRDDEKVVSIDSANSEFWTAIASNHVVLVHAKVDPKGDDPRMLTNSLVIVTNKRTYSLLLRVKNPPAVAISWRYPTEVKAEAQARKEALALAAKEGQTQ